MALRIGLAAAIWLMAGCAIAQNQGFQQDNAAPPSYQEQPSYREPAGVAERPDQPMVPQDPRLERRAPQYSTDPSGPREAGPAAQPPVRQSPPPPFTLTPEQEVETDRLLQFWEQRSSTVKTFNCRFYRFEYNAVFSQENPNQPNNVDEGQIRYSAPDKGMFRIDRDVVRGGNPRPEHWICDGKAVFQYDFQKSQVIEYKLPPEQQGRGILDGPLPFIFGARAAQLKGRYWIRVSTPADAKGQVWLEVYPKYQQDAANFRRVDVILTANDMQPYALQLYDPTGKSRIVYQFQKMAFNSKDLGQIFEDPFTPRVPRGWQLVPDDAARQNSLTQPAASSRPTVGKREPLFAPK